jgi:membrane-bound acyltransferase YfiQ involved in biofilm formation
VPCSAIHVLRVPVASVAQVAPHLVSSYLPYFLLTTLGWLIFVFLCYSCLSNYQFILEFL